MRIVRFRDPSGYVRNGKWTENGIIFSGKEYDKNKIEILPPVDPTKVVCVGLNYKDHAEETNSEIPERPMLFLKTPNTITGHEDLIELPSGKERVDYEAELAVVIGKQCKNVDKEEAMEVVRGFTCLNDISNRDDQSKEQNWVRGKSFDSAAPIGPVIATPGHVPKDAEIKLRLNDELKQESSREQLIFNIRELISEITEYLTLEPGDIIATGTPSGIGSLSSGDKVEVEIEGIGKLKNYVK